MKNSTPYVLTVTSFVLLLSQIFFTSNLYILGILAGFFFIGMFLVVLTLVPKKEKNILNPSYKQNWVLSTFTVRNILITLLFAFLIKISTFFVYHWTDLENFYIYLLLQFNYSFSVYGLISLGIARLVYDLSQEWSIEYFAKAAFLFTIIIFSHYFFLFSSESQTFCGEILEGDYDSPPRFNLSTGSCTLASGCDEPSDWPMIRGCPGFAGPPQSRIPVMTDEEQAEYEVWQKSQEQEF